MTGSQQLLAESGLGGHTAQNWASHTMPLAHAQVSRKMILYAGKRKAQNNERRKILLVEASEKMQLSNLERFFKFILFYFTGRKLGCRMQDVSELNFSISEEKFFFLLQLLLFRHLTQSDRTCLSTGQLDVG